MGEYELEKATMLWNILIKNDLHSFSSKTFENICISYLYNESYNNKLPALFINFGRWWRKTIHKENDSKPYTTVEEIDIIGTDITKTNFILGECKFRNSEFNYSQYESLTKKINLEGNIYYYLFSLSGFSNSLIQLSKENKNIKLISLDDIFK